MAAQTPGVSAMPPSFVSSARVQHSTSVGLDLLHVFNDYSEEELITNR